MKNIKILLSLSCSALLMMGIYSCRDQEELTDVVVPKNDKVITSRNPTITSDRVSFTDFADFKDYYEDLEYILDTYNADYFDSIVNVMTSITTLNDIVVASVGTFGTVSDPIIRAMLNQYNEFQVDDILVTVINDRQYLLSDVTDGSLKSSIRSITKGVPLSIANVPSGAQWIDSDQVEEGLSKFWCGCTVRIVPSDCDHLRVTGNCHGFFGTHGGGDLTVTLFQDGQAPDVLLEEEISNSFEFFIDIDVFNNTVGTLYAIADSHCDNEINEGEAWYQFHPEIFAECDREERDMNEIITNANQSERMLVKTYFNKTDWSNNHCAEIFSETSTDHGQNWDRSRANLYVSVDANRLDYGDCDFLDHKFDEESATNKKHRIVRVSWGGLCAHCDGDLTGVFQKVKSGTLNRTQVVDFICCQ